MQLSQKRKIVSETCLSFSKFRFKFEHFFKKKMTPVAEAFLNLRTRKNVVREMSKKSTFRGPFQK